MSATGKGKVGKFSFEKSLGRLEDIVKSLESGELSLEDSISRFEEGVALVRDCRSFLEDSRRRVDVLLGEDDTGGPLVAPFEEDVPDEDEEEEEDLD